MISPTASNLLDLLLPNRSPVARIVHLVKPLLCVLNRPPRFVCDLIVLISSEDGGDSISEVDGDEQREENPETYDKQKKISMARARKKGGKERLRTIRDDPKPEETRGRVLSGVAVPEMSKGKGFVRWGVERRGNMAKDATNEQ